MSEHKESWCSGLVDTNGTLKCFHGHTGPWTASCKGIRYLDTSLAPCEREDLVFNVDTLCVDGWKKEEV